MNYQIFILGIIFGLIIQYARLNRFNTITGMALLKDLSVGKAIAMAIGLGAILFSIEMGLGHATFHVKPFMVGGLVFGGVLFGMGMTILGYCPGTLAISLGEGSLDAGVGIVGGVIGGIVYTVVLPSTSGLLNPDLGEISMFSMTGGFNSTFYILTVIIGISFILFSFWMNKKDANPNKNRRWIVAGIALAILNAVIVLHAVSDRIIGASTAYPYIGDTLTGLVNNSYYEKITASGSWQIVFLAGAFLSAIVFSIIRKEFKLKFVHENWKEYKGNTISKRIMWSLVGGFILIFGARMAGGCTSGHILSGGMQLAMSSLFFAVIAFISHVTTGFFFYKRN